MAKIKRDTFKDLLTELQSKTVIASKPVATIEERRYFLIVCEGERTEPIYFDYWKRFLPKHLLETVQIIGQGDIRSISSKKQSKREIPEPPTQ